MRIAALALALVAIVVALGACTADPSPSASTTEPTASAPATSSAAPTPMPPAATVAEPTKRAVELLWLTSPAFVEGGAIPAEFTCDGTDTSVPLAWTGLPGGTVALALIAHDPDAGGFAHRVVYDLDPALDGLAAGASTAADAPAQGLNSFGQVGYGGPCPPSGTHRYVFRLLAVDQPAAFRGGTPNADSVIAAADGHTLGEAFLTGTYRRRG
jgi:hypothetical protein